MARQIAPGARKILIFDPYSLDRAHAELFAQSPNTNLVHIPFGGHTPGRVLLHCGLLQEMTLAMAAGSFTLSFSIGSCTMAAASRASGGARSLTTPSGGGRGRGPNGWIV